MATARRVDSTRQPAGGRRGSGGQVLQAFRIDGCSSHQLLTPAPHAGSQSSRVTPFLGHCLPGLCPSGRPGALADSAALTDTHAGC